MDQDFEIYEGKKYSDLVKGIVANHKSKQNQIKALTQQLVDLITDPGDAVLIVPLVKGYLDSDIKNDEALVKLAQILSKKSQGGEGTQGGLSDKDLELLFSDIQKSNVDNLPEIGIIKELPSSK